MMWVAVVSFAIATGAVVALRPLVDSAMLVAIMACLSLFTLMRRAIARPHVVGLIRESQHLQYSDFFSVNPSTNRDGHSQLSSEFRFPRLFYYLGLVFIAQLTF